MKARHEFESDAAYRDYLRTYFAAMAMQGLLANSDKDTCIMRKGLLIGMALECTDELLKQLEDE